MGSPLCILLVDDSKFFLELERRFLTKTPAQVLTTPCSADVMRMTEEHRPSLIYMAIDLPGLSGLDVCRSLKDDPELGSIPIVLIGQVGSADDEQAATAAGSDAYLAKPLDQRHFLNIGHHFLVSIERRETRQSCELLIDFTCRGRSAQGRCIDLSSGGMFLSCHPVADPGESILLSFVLPGVERTALKLRGRVAWVNSAGDMIKQDYPLGYGVEFVEISDSAGSILRRYFGA